MPRGWSGGAGPGERGSDLSTMYTLVRVARLGVHTDIELTEEPQGLEEAGEDFEGLE